MHGFMTFSVHIIFLVNISVRTRAVSTKAPYCFLICKILRQFKFFEEILLVRKTFL